MQRHTAKEIPALGNVTASVKPTVTAASTAFPPSFKTSSPARVASSSAETTVPFSDLTDWGISFAVNKEQNKKKDKIRIRNCFID